MRRIGFFGIAIAFVAAGAHAESASDTAIVTIERFMNSAEMETTGVATLDSARRAALGRWLVDYVGRAVTNARPALSTPEPSLGIHWIRSISGDGRIVLLEDGSVWEIAFVDNRTVANWSSESGIVVARGAQLGEYGYKLVSTRHPGEAAAKFIGRP